MKTLNDKSLLFLIMDMERINPRFSRKSFGCFAKYS